MMLDVVPIRLRRVAVLGGDAHERSASGHSHVPTATGLQRAVIANVNQPGTPDATVHSVTTMPSEPFGMTPARVRNSLAPERVRPFADLHVATVDCDGRAWLRLSARLLGWAPGQRLSMTVRDGVVLASGEAIGDTGIAAALDDRSRVRVPLGIRAMAGINTEMRVLVVTVPSDRSVAILPVHRVLAAFGVAP